MTTEAVGRLGQAKAAALRGERPWLRSQAVTVGLLLAGLIAISAALRTGKLGANFWIDEGLSVGISSHTLFDIPGVLRQDGSPPLYYMLLHGWMAVAGKGVEETHALSLLFSLASIPAGLWAGWSLFGRRAGIFTAALLAVNPLLSAYSQETRMYSLLVLLSLLTAAGFVHAFVFGRRRFLFLFAAGLAGLLYTHNWGLFFALGLAAALAGLAAASRERRALLRDGALGFAAVALLYMPWVPTLLFQAAHTGAPWAAHPSLSALGGGASFVLGGPEIAVALLLGGGAGLVAVRSGREGRAGAALLAAPAIGLVSAFVYSQLSLAWAPRYLTVFLAPVVLAAGLGLARAGRLGIVAFALAAWLSIGATGGAVSDDKSNVARLQHELGNRLLPGDVVLSLQPEQVPVLHYYLPPRLRYATETGFVEDPLVMDWRDAEDRLRLARPLSALPPLLDRIPVGRRVLVVRPVTQRRGWRAPWTRLVRVRSRGWQRAISRDRRLRKLDGYAPERRSRLSTLRAVLYVKRSR